MWRGKLTKRHVAESRRAEDTYLLLSPLGLAISQVQLRELVRCKFASPGVGLLQAYLTEGLMPTGHKRAFSAPVFKIRLNRIEWVGACSPGNFE